jgi:DNA repair protein RecN (Recombination protein N)
MLKELQITNLALIEKLQISFDQGLSVLTGETGAGKSIILQSLNLLLGGKASPGWIRSGAEAATLEALFSFSPGRAGMAELLAEKGIRDDDGELLIKRIISDSGRSRFFINGSLATGKLVSDILENLLSVASQHDHQQLLVPRFHLDFIDAVGDLWKMRTRHIAAFEKWSSLKKQHDELLRRERDKEQRREFLRFQYKEIKEAGFTPGEEETLLQERDLLKSSDELRQLGQQSHHLLAEAVESNLTQVRKNLERMSVLDAGLEKTASGIADHCYQLEDFVVTLRNYTTAIPNDPFRLEIVTARIDLLQRLKRKYGQSIEEILAFAESAGRELEELEALEERQESLSRHLAEAGEELLALARSLSGERRRAAEALSGKIRQELVSLCFVQADFAIRFPEHANSMADLGRLGWDHPEFLFSANPGEPLKPLADIASGGELSRLMLALKCLFAHKDQVETVIFDEVDAGISGKAAEAVARKIKELSDHHQVICITHLPQIAACARDHFRVEKIVQDQRTRTMIQQLDQDDRTEEIARMLDGDSVTARTLDYVRELMARSRPQ